MAHETTDQTFDQDVLQSALPVIVDFWAPWCGPCKAMNPIWDSLEKTYEGKVSFVKMNVDENQEVPGRYGVMSIPTFIIVKNGVVASQFVGARGEQDMQRDIDAALASS